MNNSKKALLKANNKARSNFKMKFYNCGARLSIADQAHLYFDLSKQYTVRSKQFIA